MALLIGGVGRRLRAVLYPFFSALLWAGDSGVHHLAGVRVAARAHLRLRERGAAAGVMVALTAVVLVLPLALAAPGGGDDVNHLRQRDRGRAARRPARCRRTGCSGHPAGRSDAGRSVEPLGRRHRR